MTAAELNLADKSRTLLGILPPSLSKCVPILHIPLRLNFPFNDVEQVWPVRRNLLGIIFRHDADAPPGVALLFIGVLVLGATGNAVPTAAAPVIDTGAFDTPVNRPTPATAAPSPAAATAAAAAISLPGARLSFIHASLPEHDA